MNTYGLNLRDRWGVCFGTGYFLLMLPVTVFVAGIPTVIVSREISNHVLALTVNMGVLSLGILISLLSCIAIGLATSYGAVWGWHMLGVQRAFFTKSAAHKPIESGRRIGIGAFIGGAISVFFFFRSGGAPIATVTARVEHLFPAPLLMSMGNLKLNISQIYSEAVGYMGVGFLFVIIGVTIGSVAFALLERFIISRRSVK